MACAPSHAYVYGIVHTYVEYEPVPAIKKILGDRQLRLKTADIG